ncbi:MAG TPA: hypothetical protein VFM48_07425 [Aquabacterium sp.]|nr:hypothetical protein [Aquabacterium sp.]
MTSAFKRLLQQREAARHPPETPHGRARALIDAIDAGGIPLNPAIVNQIARNLGLEVSAQAPMDDTISRIRALLESGR